MSKGVVLLAAGGTGGHMFPAEALAQELKRRGRRIVLITDARGARYASDFPADEKVEIAAASPNVGGLTTKLKAVLSTVGGFASALSAIRKRNVDAAIGFGGYPSFAAMQAASLLKIPYGVHEQNGVLGRTNRMLAGAAAFTAHAFPSLARTPQAAAARLQEVGNPVRDAVTDAASVPYQAPEPGGQIRLLVFGGSQGASLFSDVAPKAINALPADLRARLKITQQARESEVAAVEAAYAEAGVQSEIASFFSDLPRRIADAHLVISRSGASTVTELSVIGRPSILTPLAIAMDDHQTGNARVLSDAGAAVLLPETAFTPERLAPELQTLVGDPDILPRMAIAAKDRVRLGAAATLADLVERIAERQGRKP
ncbi:MAG: undecaprenyldiphospho-muramoylpentapeptide beta-N-acetylglucosaminyltransferase [Pseudomonadota bacterium]